VSAARHQEVRILGDAEARVLGDSGRLEQVIVNLVSNALASGGAPVEVEVRQVGERVNIQVRDRGPGIAAELRSLVFEPFFTTRARGEGTGLGLAISRSIVEEHGGTIEVDDNPGGGARFDLWLPAAPATGG
jgi:signal transduction histidine kinase